MTEILVWTFVAATGATGLFVAVLVVRRMLIGRRQRRHAAFEQRLRPLALALIDGDPVTLPRERAAASVLAGLIGRYSAWLTGAARERIAAYFEQSGALDQALRSLRHRRAWRRADAAFALGDMASSRAVPSLVSALEDSERDVRAAAARSLGRLGATTAVPSLVDALAHGRVPAAVAGQALLTIGAAALPALEQLVADEDDAVRAASIELIGFLGDASQADLLVSRLRDPSAEVRAKAARALGRVGADDAAAALRTVLDDRVAFVRVSAAHALGTIGDPEAAPALIAVAEGDQFEAAQAAAMALARVAPAALSAAARRSSSRHLLAALDLASVRR